MLNIQENLKLTMHKMSGGDRETKFERIQILKQDLVHFSTSGMKGSDRTLTIIV